MNILERYPNATKNQKKQLKKARDDWEKAIIKRGNPPVSEGSLDGMRKDYYGDITENYKKRINEIITKPDETKPVIKARTFSEVVGHRTQP